MRKLAQAQEAVDAQVAQVGTRQRITGHVIGTIDRRNGTRVWVDFPGNAQGPLLARSVIPIEELPRPSPGAARPEVLLVFEEERPNRPIILELLSSESRTVHLRRGSGLEARLEGRRAVLAGEDELVLRCGKASITLRRNGRLVIRGTHVVSDSEGVNRIRGASVQVE